jgi:hypothetical protein
MPRKVETTSTVIRQLFEGYEVEGLKVPYTLDDFYRDFIQSHADEILEKLPPERRVKGLSPEQRVKGLSADELERLLKQQREAEAAEPKKGGKPGRGSPKRRSK